jgi:alkaline phosphatase D
LKVKDENNIKISFGSCNKFYRSHKSDIFYDIAKQNTDVWVWLGDIAYTDNMKLLGLWYADQDFEKNKQKFEITKNDPGKKLIINTNL